LYRPAMSIHGMAWWRAVLAGAASRCSGHPLIRVLGQHLGHNALAGLSYTVGVVLLGGFQILSGLALFAQDAPTGKLAEVTGWLIVLAGGPFRLLMLHHVAAWLIVTFVILHVYIVIYDSTAYRNGLVSAMITGRKFYQKGDVVQDTWIG